MIREQVLGIVAMEPMGEYSANVKYEKLNIVTYNGSTYSALKDTLGNEPTNDEYWQLIAKKGDKGDTYELTDEDKENIKNDITENANSDFNKNVESKTNTFNDNVTEKTSSFNANVENKTKEFNDNSTTKLEEFNTNSTNKLEEYNTNANAKLNEYNANADGVMTIAVDTRNELERVKNDILETGEASGDYLHLEDSTMAELQELEINSVEKQVTTTGKNVFNNAKFEWYPLDGTNGVEDSSKHGCHSDYSELKPNTNYTFKNITMQDGVYFTLHFYDENKNWIKAITGDNGGTIWWSNIQTFNTGDNIKYMRASYLYIGIHDIINCKIQLEEGATATEYEPYTGGTASPNPDYPQDIPMITTDTKLKSTGKNLLIYKDVISGQGIVNTLNVDGSITSKGLQTKDYINLTLIDGNKKISKGKYTFSIDKPVQFTTSIRFQRADGSTFEYKITAGKTSATFELNEEHVNYYLYYHKNGTAGQEINITVKFQLEVGDKATEYEPYQESILNLPIPEGEFVGYINDNAKDKFRVGYNEEDGAYHLYLDKMLGRVVLNGSENWVKSGNTNDKTFVGVLAGIANVKDVFITKDIYLVTTHFNRKTTVEWTNGLYSLYNRYSGEDIKYKEVFEAFALTLDINQVATIDEFKVWLSENKPEIVYILAEPYTLDLGMVDMPLSYDGITNIFVDTDLLMNINIKYYRNFTETVRNLQINNDTLKNELASIESRLSALEVAKASNVNESEVEE